MKSNDTQKKTLLIVDDEPLVLELLSSGLKREGFRVLCADDGQEAMRVVQGECVDLAVIDYSLPDICGSELFKQFLTVDPDLPVIMLTGHPNLETAVSLMKHGIRDYLSKPFSLQEVSSRIRSALEPVETGRASVCEARSATELPASSEYVFGNSEAIRAVEAQVKDLSRYPNTTVLISGPTGTGKTAVARRIHELSCGETAPFVEIDCSTIPHELCESELFGHEKGAFTGAHCTKRGLFEAAGRGTAFLDEIGELEPQLQVKFLRVLEARQFKRVGGHLVLPMGARVVAATNRSLPELVRAGKFREDLFFRLNVIELYMPPLRERGEDVPMLARHFLKGLSRRHNKNIIGFTAKALAFLQEYDFPGNIRELRNVIERAVILAETAEIDLPQLVCHRAPSLRPPSLAVASSAPRPGSESELAPARNSTLAQLEKNLLFDALTVSQGNKSKAAQLVGLSRTAFHRRLQKHSSAAAFESKAALHITAETTRHLVLPASVLQKGQTVTM